MVKGSLIDRVYTDVKAELTRRSLLPGQRIDLADMCERHRTSASPMRNALNRLVGEGLIEAHAHDGFYIPRVTEKSLHDLFSWNERILLLALEDLSADALASTPPAEHEDTAIDTEIVFSGLAALSGNQEVTRAVHQVNDRLRSLRSLPSTSLLPTGGELSDLRGAWLSGDRKHLADLLRDYHARRLAVLPHLIALAYTAPLATSAGPT